MGHQGQCGKAGRDGTGTNASLGAIAKSKHTVHYIQYTIHSSIVDLMTVLN